MTKPRRQALSPRQLALAQEGVLLAEAMPHRSAAEAQQEDVRELRTAPLRRRAVGRRSGPPAGMRKLRLPAPPKLSPSERLRILDGFESVMDGIYTHLPLKRARYGFDPVQRLRILRSQIDKFDDNGFHVELAAVVTQMRDYHTRYTWPQAFAGKVAALPFLVEMYGSEESPTYTVSKVGRGLDPDFVPGVELRYWNGVPIDRAVVRHSEEECAGRPDSVRSAALQSLTFRSMEFGPPPDEDWVVVGYRRTTAAGQVRGGLKEVRVPWKVLSPRRASTASSEASATRRPRAINPAAADVRAAKMLLFAPAALAGRSPPDLPPGKGARSRQLGVTSLRTVMPSTLRVQVVKTARRTIGYLRIWEFDTDAPKFIAELLRLIPLLPPDGLIIDVRGNPGGYILAAEKALQLFTPKTIEPCRFSVLATTFTRKMAEFTGPQGDLHPWKSSLDAAVRNGEIYSQPLPISDPADCNSIGQRYGGPVMLVGDTNTYSAGDLFSAGFVDNDIGPFLCVGQATGAGGANVWDYGGLRKALRGSTIELPALTGGIGLSFAFRRATRIKQSEGLTIEDVGIEGHGKPYEMTRGDLLDGNRDLLLQCVDMLGEMPLSALAVSLHKKRTTVVLSAHGLDQLDVWVDGHPFQSVRVSEGSTLEVPLPHAKSVIEAAGYRRSTLLQSRRIALEV